MKSYLVASLSVTLLSCAELGILIPPLPLVPPDIPISELLAAKDTITVEGRGLTLSTYMWRDFMPISPPGGKPLIAIAYVTGIDPAALPASINADAIWIVNVDQVWKSFFTDEIRPLDPANPNRLERVARNGPLWGPNIYVEVVVRVLDGRGNKYLLRAGHQWIGRTD